MQGARCAGGCRRLLLFLFFTPSAAHLRRCRRKVGAKGCHRLGQHALLGALPGGHGRDVALNHAAQRGQPQVGQTHFAVGAATVAGQTTGMDKGGGSGCGGHSRSARQDAARLRHAGARTPVSAASVPPSLQHRPPDERLPQGRGRELHGSLVLAGISALQLRAETRRVRSTRGAQQGGQAAGDAARPPHPPWHPASASIAPASGCGLPPWRPSQCRAPPS